MDIITIISTVLGGLIVAGLLGWIKKSRLVVLVPNLFSYSAITDKGQIAELIIHNRGPATEEAIEITLSDKLNYNILGSDNSEIALNGCTLTITRIVASTSITVLLLVDGVGFSQKDIKRCISRKATGKVLLNTNLIPFTWQARVGFIVFCIILIVTGTISYRTAKHYGAKQAEKEFDEMIQQRNSTAANTQGWEVADNYRFLSGHLFKNFVAGNIRLTVGKVSHSKEQIIVPVIIENSTQHAFKVLLNVTNSISNKKLPPLKGIYPNILIMPGSTEEKIATLLYPTKPIRKNDKLVFIECYINSNNDTLQINKTINVD